MFKKLLLVNELMIAVIFLASCYLYDKYLFADADVAWHAAVGFYIRAHGIIPLNDSWSFASDQTWYNISWLWDLMVSYVFSWFGESGANLLNYILNLLLVLYIYQFIKTFKVRNDVKNIAITLVAMFIWSNLVLRPVIASMLITTFLMCFFRKRKNEDLSVIYIFPIIMALWVNLHGGFLVGITILGAHGLENLYKKNYKEFKVLFLAGILGLCGTLLNPMGFDIYIGTLRTLDSIATTYIMEWHPFTFGSQYATSLLVVVCILLVKIDTRETKISDKILFYFWLLISFSSIRSFQFFVIVGMPHFLNSLEVTLPRAKYEKPMNVYARSSIMIATLLLTIVVRNNVDVVTHAKKIIPTEEIKFLKENYAGKNVLCNYDDGGFIIYYGEGKFKHFVDGRAGTAFSEDVLKEAIDFQLVKPGWNKIFEKYKIDAVLIKKNALQSHDLSEFFKNWNIAYNGLYYLVLKP